MVQKNLFFKPKITYIIFIKKEDVNRRSYFYRSNKCMTLLIRKMYIKYICVLYRREIQKSFVLVKIIAKVKYVFKFKIKNNQVFAKNSIRFFEEHEEYILNVIYLQKIF